jgi:hypothetical protein
VDPILAAYNAPLERASSQWRKLVIRVSFELPKGHAAALDRMLRCLTFETVSGYADSEQERFDLILAVERLRVALEQAEASCASGDGGPATS